MSRCVPMLVSGLVLSLVLTADEPGVKVQLMGGTLAEIQAKSDARIDLTDDDALLVYCRGAELRIPYQQINTIEYGQTVSRHYIAAILISPIVLLSKSRRHFVTLGYADFQGRQQAFVVRVDKGDIRPVLAGLTARTGRRIEYQDEEARKAGKG